MRTASLFNAYTYYYSCTYYYGVAYRGWAE